LVGATNARLVLAAAALSNAGSYAVTLSNSVGVVTSTPALLIVNPAPTQPGSLAREDTAQFGANGEILAMAAQNDGKLVVGGFFTSIAGVPRNHIARLEQNGAVDPSFDPGSGVTGYGSASVNALALQEDGKLLIAGAFNAINGALRTNFAR